MANEKVFLCSFRDGVLNINRSERVYKLQLKEINLMD